MPRAATSLQTAPQAVDGVDLTIITSLVEDARKPLTSIAQQLKLTTKTVLNRIRRLEKSGVIVGYRCELDTAKLGYRHYKLHIRTQQARREDVRAMRQYAHDHKNIVYDDIVLGGYDLEFELQVETELQLREFLDAYTARFAHKLRAVEVLWYFQEYRLRFFPRTALQPARRKP